MDSDSADAAAPAAVPEADEADEADSGAVTLIQRFGSAANLMNPQLHCPLLNGASTRRTRF